MRISCFCVVYAVVLVESHISACAQGIESQKQSMLENLKKTDAAHAPAFTVSGTIRSQDAINDAGDETVRVDRRFKLTFDGDRIGYQMDASDYEKPRYRLRKRGGAADGANDGAKDMRVIIRTKELGYWAADLSGRHFEDTVLFVRPTGDVVESGKMYNSFLYGPQAEGSTLFRRILFWSMGRFLSPGIEKVTEQQEAENGTIIIQASGRKEARNVGRWKLTIEPQAAWLIRRAEFYSDERPDQKNLEMHNSGAIWSGSRCIPEKAEINYVGPLSDAETYQLTFSALDGGFDKDLYGDCRRAVLENAEINLTVHDRRVKPAVITEPNRHKPKD